MSPEKQTRIGPGHFVTWVTTYTRRSDGEVVGRQTFRILKFKPEAGALVMSERLAPSMTADTQFFWDGVKDGRLLIQRCAACGALRHPPRPMCPHCTVARRGTRSSRRGTGTVYSFVLPRHPQFPWFEDDYIVALSSSRRARES